MIQPHSSWEIRDSSKLSEFRRCPRKFFYRYLLGWESEQPNNDLWFGESVHKGLEIVTLKGFSHEALSESLKAFINHYRLKFPPETDDFFKGKSPAGFVALLTKYADTYASDPYEYEPLYTEISGSVPISDQPERRLHFRMDSILRRRKDGMVCSLEHKTTGLSLNEAWKAQHELSLQVGTYTHVLHCIYKLEEILGVLINGLSIRLLKSGHVIELERVPVFKTFSHLQTWIWEINDLWDTTEFEMDRLMNSCKEDDEVLMAYPRRTEACMDFFRKCTYHDFCCTWSNPLQHCDEPPLGFKEEFWDPREMDTRHKMDLTTED